MTWLVQTCKTPPSGSARPRCCPGGDLCPRGRQSYGHRTHRGRLAPAPPDVNGQIQCLYGAARVAVAAGAPHLAERELESLSFRLPFVRHAVVSIEALLAATAGDHRQAIRLYEDAARRWRTFGAPYEEAHALVGLGSSQSILGRVGDARATLAHAESSFATLGAAPDLGNVRRLRQSLTD